MRFYLVVNLDKSNAADCAAEAAAELLRCGAEPARIYPALYEEEFSHIRLRAQLTMQIRFTPHRVAYLYTDAAAARASNFNAAFPATRAGGSAPAPRRECPRGSAP